MFKFILYSLPLKQSLAILLLALHSFNLAGYTLLFDYLMQRSDKQLIQQLDNNQYNDGELIEVKIALHTPYLTNWSSYERVDGEVEVNGVYFSYVKRKIYQDTLYLLCLPNTNKTQLHQARAAYATHATDVPAHAKDTGAGKKNPLGFEYRQPAVDYTITFPVHFTGHKKQPTVAAVLLPFLKAPFHPPRV